MHGHLHREPLKAQGDWQVIFRLIPYLWAFKWRLLIALLFLIGAKAATVMVPLILKKLVDYFEQQPDVEAVVVVVPVALLLAYGGLRFASILFGELRDAVFAKVAERSLSQLGLTVFNHLHRLDLEYHLSRRTGGLSRDIERGTSSVSFLLRSFVFSIIPIVVELVLVMGILWSHFDWRYVLATLFAVLVYLVFTVIVTEWRNNYVREANRKDSAANTRAVDSLLNFETVKYFNNEAYEEQAYAVDLAAREKAKISNTLSLTVLNAGQGLIIASTVTAIMLLASWQLTQRQISLGDLVMLNAFMIQLFVPLNAMGFIYRELKRCFADVEAMFDILAEQPSIRDPADARELSLDADGIEFKRVSFAYDPARPILQDLSFVIPAGSRLAIVGASGAGKSTIARLLFRFYDVSAGSICIGGEDIRKVTQDSVRAAIGVVPQDTVLFNDTIFHNVAYGKPGVSAAAVDNAVELAHLTAFIKSLPKGYDTLVGERGLKVSGGEKQRIAIARAMLKQPRILIFDEATSSLDSGTEKQIVAALDEVAARRTTLVIAHRLSTIKNADHIIVLDQGRVVERGDHESLMAEQGHYYTLWQTQHQHAREGAGLPL